MSEKSNQTAKAMLVLRLSLVLFLLPWVIEKFTQPEQTAKIFSHFYHIDLPVAGSYVVGVIWALLLLAFAAGFKKRISYGLVMVLHGLTTIFTIPQMLPFLPTYNHLFVAAIPVLGGLIALYMLRDHDSIWTVG